MPNMNRWMFIICLIIVEAMQVCARNHYGVSSNNINWAGSCLDTQDVSERIVGFAFPRCLRECLARPHCRAINYWTLTHVCDIAEDDVAIDVAGATGGIPISDGSCVNVRRGDIVRMSTVGSNCSSCPNYNVCSMTEGCTVQVCPKLTVDNATLYGNMRTVGARVVIVCPNGAKSQAVCENNGTWSGVTPCVKNCSHDDDDASLVRVGNMTFVVHTEARDQPSAQAFCQETGHDLLKLDTPERHDVVRAHFQSKTEYTDTQLWVQGTYAGRQWVFDDDKPMPTDGRLWYDKDGSSSCVLLDGRRQFLWDDRSCRNIYAFVCEAAQPKC